MQQAYRPARRIVVNPDVPKMIERRACECVVKTACEGMPEVVAGLLAAAGA